MRRLSDGDKRFEMLSTLALLPLCYVVVLDFAAAQNELGSIPEMDHDDGDSSDDEVPGAAAGQLEPVTALLGCSFSPQYFMNVHILGSAFPSH